MAERINQLYRSFWGEEEDYTEIKHKYNQLLLSKESEIWSRIKQADDCIEECIKYVSAGNYIDFSAVENVNEQTLDTLLDRAKKESVPEDIDKADTLAEQISIQNECMNRYYESLAQLEEA